MKAIVRSLCSPGAYWRKLKSELLKALIAASTCTRCSARSSAASRKRLNHGSVTRSNSGSVVWPVLSVPPRYRSLLEAR